MAQLHKDAEELDRDALFSAVIHELRAPLNACLMSLNLLELKSGQPAEVLRCAEVIRRNLDRQARLIQDLADALHAMSGAPDSDRERIELDDVLAPIMETARQPAAEQGVELDWEEGPAPPVNADPEKLTRVFETLLNAALAAVRTGRIDVSASASRGGDARVTIRSVDHGAEGGARDAGEPPRDHKSLAVRVSLAEQVLNALGGQLERGERGFTVELPAAGREP